MTMLDRMRRHRNWLKYSLFLVVLAFGIYFIPYDKLQPNGVAVVNDTIATVEGQEIRAEEFRRAYQSQVQQYRAQFGGQMSDQLLKQLGIEQQILGQIVEERAQAAEASRLGLQVSDQEVAQRIFAIPAFQENGTFIGAKRYQDLLASQPVPLSIREFEEGIRRMLLAQKLQSSVTEWLSVSDKELEDEYRRRNDKVKLAVIAFNSDSYRPDVSATDAEVASYFESHQADFKIPEKRKVKYLLVDIEALREKVVVPQADLERTYNQNFEQYSTPEQIRASHILLKTEGKDDAAVKAKAEEILKQAKGGADFAELAKKNSEDESNNKNGGDLDFFGRGRMVPEFDAVAFALQPGQISDVVKTQFGYHIIKLTDKKPAVTKPLAEVKDQLAEQLQYERAQTQAQTTADQIAKELTKPADFERVAAAHGLQVQETGFFAANEPILGVGAAPQMTSRAFTMKDGEVSGALQTGRGYAFETVTAKQDPYVPKLDEVKERVRDEVVRQKAVAMAKEKAAEASAKLKTAADFDKAAKAALLEPKTTELITRDGSIPELGAAPDVIAAAFALPVGSVSDAIPSTNGAAVVKVLDKQQSTPADLSANKDSFREQVLNDRRGRFFSAYMQKAKQKMKIEVNREVLAKVIGG
jgi:peptidyl-prolyl cis-trans isomerase D